MEKEAIQKTNHEIKEISLEELKKNHEIKDMEFDEIKEKISLEAFTLEELNLLKNEYLYELDILEKILIELYNNLPTRSFKDINKCLIILRIHYEKKIDEINEKYI